MGACRARSWTIRSTSSSSNRRKNERKVDGARGERPDRMEHRFVLRLWREPSTTTPQWRGSIVEVTSDARVVSSDLDDLWDFVMLRLQRHK
jgi:hypothetical protein